MIFLYLWFIFNPKDDKKPVNVSTGFYFFIYFPASEN